VTAAEIRDERRKMNAMGPEIRDHTTHLREERMHVLNCVRQDWCRDNCFRGKRADGCVEWLVCRRHRGTGFRRSTGTGML